MKSDSTIDILGCSLIDDNGKLTNNCSRFPTPIRIFNDASGLSKIAPKIFTPATIMTDWDHLQSRQVDQVIGAFMFMRKSIFEKIGYFDEQFFVYFEEVDFSKRLALANGKTYFNSAIKAIHSGEGTTHSVKAFRLFLSLRSRLQYSKKHFSYAGYLLVWFSTFLIEPFARILFLIFKGNAKEVKGILRGYNMLIKNNTK
jgi:GT2 family glycosyltransferase